MLRRLLLFLISIFLLLFLFQEITNAFPVGRLNGAFERVKRPQLVLDSVLNGSYQKNLTAWVNENFGFRNTLVRLHNQIGYWLYKQAYTNAVIVGKEEFLLDKKYIDAYTGADFLGEDVLRKKVQLVKMLQDSLQAHHIQFLFVMAPGKASFYKEYIPDEYLTNVHPGNYECLTKLFVEMGVNHIDFRKWFDDLKPKSKYPLFPKCGIHWSTYGADLAADSIIKRIEALTATKMPHMVFESIHVPDTLRTVDEDVGKGMNLLWNIKNIPMAYPTISYTDVERKVKLLTVGDSYNWTMPLYNMTDSVFKKMDYIYYNKKLFVNNRGEGYEDEQINRARLILGHDVVMILTTDANLADFGWGFFENTYYGIFDLRSRTGRHIPMDVAVVMNDVRYDPQQYSVQKDIAKKLNIPIDSAIYLEAIRLMNLQKSAK